ncbi:MAG TPA: hypothetical protein DDX39_06065 [Bacteroidales bacterium]|nr:hypothetical protein [Bacteroidales bacterium]
MMRKMYKSMNTINIKQKFRFLLYSPFVFLLLFNTNSFAQTVDFTANDTVGCDNLFVEFQNTSSGEVNSYLWDFGDGSPTSTDENPTNYYDSPGNYTVTLIVLYDSGSNDTLVKTNFIEVNQSPTVNFSTNLTSGCFPLTVNFTDVSVAGNATINSWFWDFGNGDNSSSQNPAYTYETPGDYNISFFINDTNDCNVELNLPDYISVINNELSADFTIENPIGCELPHLTNFTNTSSGTVLSYLWTYNDSLTSTDENLAQQTYNEYGIYTVSLLIEGSSGCIDSVSKQIEVKPFYASFSSNKTSGCAPLSVTFYDNSLEATSWSWNFGDAGTSSSKNPSHTFTNPGVYTVYLSSSNSSCSGDTTKVDYITVFAPPVTSFFASDSSECKVPFTVNFTSTTDSIVEWAWTFGDGQTSTEESPSHTYDLVSNYTVKLTTTDANGCFSSLTANSLIKIIEPVADFNFDIDKGCKALPVNFTDLTVSNESITNWNWNFGDGGTSIEQNPLYSYPDTGSFTVTLIIENINGCVDTVQYVDTILVGDHKEVNFAPLDTTICYSDFVQFRDLSDPEVDEWHWLFFSDNGSISQLQNPIHSYLDTGYYHTMLVAGFHGCYDTLIVDSNVLVHPPIARFNADKLIFCEAENPYTVSFRDTSVYATSWLWKFGDGDTAMTQHATHTFIERDFYDVWLFVENSIYGCEDSISQTIKISDIRVGFTVDTTIGCEPLTIHFSDTTYANSSSSSWLWNFGDGQISTEQNPIHVFNYNDSVFFDVRLYTTDALGCTDSIVTSSLVEIKRKPSPSFIDDGNISGCVSLLTEFTDQSVPYDSEISSWAWNFGDGSAIDTTANPSHNYSARGVYDVTLTVKDTFQCSNSISKPDLIYATFPYTSFTSADVICNNTSVTFTNNSTSTYVGDVLTYVWDFGDGDTSSTQNPNHVFSTTSDTSVIFNVSLTATDLNGCDSTFTKEVRIASVQAGFVASETNATCPPFYVTFTDTSLCTPDSVISWLWNFGDNTTPPATSNNKPSHSYFNSGIYGVSLIASNTYGCNDTIVLDSLININGPIGSISYSIDSSTCSPTIEFIAQSENSVLNIWDFDDGNSAIGDTVYYFYPDTGTFSPVLIIEDAGGCSDEIELDSALHVMFPTLALSLSSTNATCAMQNGSATILSVSGGLTPYSYLWPNGQTDSIVLNLLGGVYYITATDSAGCPGRDSILVDTDWIQFNNSFNYQDAICLTNNGYAQSNPTDGFGTYTYSWSNGETLNSINNLDNGLYHITITDSLGCFIVDSVLISRDTSIVIADTILHKDAMCAVNNGYAISIPSGGYAPYSYSWSNGINNDSILNLAANTYFITITDSLGCSTIDSVIIALGENNTINADFEMDSLEILGGLPVHLTDQSTDSVDVVEWTWNIEEESYTDTLGFYTYTFYEAGIYPIELIIKDEIGCLDTIAKNIIIKEGIAIPNVFSPNGDGKNDVFYVVSNGISEYSIEIFNRWGALIFTETSPYIQWTGRTTAGVEVPVGTYFYVLHAATKTGKTIEESGFITLVR